MNTESSEENAKSPQKSIRSGKIRRREAFWGQKYSTLPRSSEVISGLDPRRWGPLWKREGPGPRVEAERCKRLSSPPSTGCLGNWIACSSPVYLCGLAFLFSSRKKKN